MWQKVAKFKGAEYFRKALYTKEFGNLLYIEWKRGRVFGHIIDTAVNTIYVLSRTRVHAVLCAIANQ
jgi:hypothetical protein